MQVCPSVVGVSVGLTLRSERTVYKRACRTYTVVHGVYQIYEWKLLVGVEDIILKEHLCALVRKKGCDIDITMNNIKDQVLYDKKNLIYNICFSAQKVRLGYYDKLSYHWLLLNFKISILKSLLCNQKGKESIMSDLHNPPTYCSRTVRKWEQDTNMKL